MKKMIAFIALVLGFFMNNASAQPPAGGQMDPAQRIAMLKERLKPIGLTEVQADTAVAVFMDRSMMGNMRDMSPEDRQAKMKEVSEAREKRLEKTLGKELTKKVMELMSQRPGGGPARQ